jgi:hypothetical protein
LQDFYNSEITELQDRKRELLREHKLNSMIVSYFIPQIYLQRIQEYSEYNEADDTYRLPMAALAGNIISQTSE